MSVQVEDGTIREFADRPIASTTAQRVDLQWHTLMPGLIDCHVHVVALAHLGQNAMLPDALVAYHAARIMQGMRQRGLTTVRDVGGATEALVVRWSKG